MKKRLKFLLVSFWTVASFTACQSDDSEGVMNSRSITVSTNYDALTRAGGMTTDELKNKSFYLYIDQTAGGATDYFVKMKWEDNAWKSYSPANGSIPVVLQADGETLNAKVVALFYDSEVALTQENFKSDVTSYAINSDATSNYSPDMLYAMTKEAEPSADGLKSGTVEITGTTIKVIFDHALSRLKFNINASKIIVTSIQVSQVATSFTWGASTNSAFLPNQDKNSFNVALPAIIEPTTKTGENLVAECFLVPQTSDFKATVTYKQMSDNKTYKAEYTYNDQLFVSGVSYSMALPPADGEAQSPITRASVNEDDWVNGDTEGSLDQQVKR